jgi:phosphatidylglycerophosphate synthase
MSRAADLCTGLRVLLAPVLAWQFGLPREQAGLMPLVVYMIAAVSDAVDGQLARAAGTASRRGRVFDHAADALLLFPSLFVLAGGRRVPFALPIAAVAAFALYVLDGWRRGGSLAAIDLTASRSGAVGGVLNYGVVGAAAVAVIVDLRALDQAIHAAAFAVAAVNAAAAFERVQLMLMPARATRAAETESRAPHSSP